ncbi:MAG: hypothetical protein KUA43_02215 [Hoeflea sp.]|uniref:hypothetical protein n=1 Tax=Hoeflea sp. TaxID=1940281 RepID=UPI001DC56E3C|nr:hypothetical protein [Hoeflea sp.]MBU4530685.1 hypothetical protein [Alphaproteobacteria bacterium]MBU4544905.1 hypothetical protein [Alphaproteobacteria bacterium]MBU4552048.1 hypothetical protein [Alphaproteobacteria bacterium]MBV1722237.1 hypothetical protein [Hoeflea sp.]MBV1761799.1 hypothetical protein [Hoeflea sp.]
MIPFHRPVFVAFVAILAAGCQTASLEDAAPVAATVVTSEVPAAPAIVADAATTGTAGTPDPAAEPVSAAPTVIRKNPGIMSVVPIEQTTPVATQDFVDTGARRTGEYPTFGRMPQAANTQMTDAEKRAAEAEMAELLRARAATPGARAQYEARLRQLRALAANHGSDAQKQIEK